ncbi:MAG TPA: peptidoglycan-binding protein [Stellaceae bacterium]|jgi:lysozyme family protein|nr:peptidoglycan-binding protein [Stellaceae bacterium]
METTTTDAIPPMRATPSEVMAMIKTLQIALRAYGYTGEIDGVIGAETTKAATRARYAAQG